MKYLVVFMGAAAVAGGWWSYTNWDHHGVAGATFVTVSLGLVPGFWTVGFLWRGR